MCRVFLRALRSVYAFCLVKDILRILVFLLGSRLVHLIWLGSVVLRLAEVLLDVSDHPLLRPIVVVGFDYGIDLTEVVVWISHC